MVRTRNRAFSLLLVLVLILALLPGSALAATEVPSVSITLAAPAVGAHPDYTAEFPSGAHYYSAAYNDEYYRNDVIWKDVTADAFLDPVSGVFLAGHRYMVSVYLTPEAGFSFTDDTSAALNGQTADETYLTAGHQFKVTYTFPMLPGPIPAVELSLDAPAVGASPDYTPVFPEGAPYFSAQYNKYDYRNDVIWYEVINGGYFSLDPENDVFQAGRQYRVVVYLTAPDGFSFLENTTATLNGMSPEETEQSGVTIFRVAHTYPLLTETIPSVSVTLDAPTIDAHPDYTAEFPADAHYYSDEMNTSILCNDVAWWDVTANSWVDPENGVFLPGHAYRVDVYLTEQFGYLFTPNTTARLNGYAVPVSDQGYGQILVSYTFPALPEAIRSVAITLDAPSVGAHPDYTAEFPSGAHCYSSPRNSVSFRNDIVWYSVTNGRYYNMEPDRSVFQVGAEYSVTIYLTAQEGYVFAPGAKATLNGQTAKAARVGGQLMVTYTFPGLEWETKPDDVGFVNAEAVPGTVIVSWPAVAGADHYRIARQSTGTGWELLDGNCPYTDYGDVTAVPGSRYRYLVCAENSVGKGGSAISEVVTAMAIPTTVPDAVGSITAEALPGKVVVSWTPAEGAYRYRLARESPVTGLALLEGNIYGTSYEDTTVVPGSRYRYMVQAENNHGLGGSAFSAEVTALAPLALPDAVASIAAIARPGKVIVSWTAADGADHYRLARQSTGTGWVLLDGNISGISYEDTSAEAGKRYRYLVCAENDLGKGGSATSAVVTALAPMSLPDAVASITAVARPGKVLVSWTAAQGADHYRLARQSTGTGWVLLDGNISGTSYEDITAEAGKRYRYLVCAENGAGKGGSATSAVVTALASAAVPAAVASANAVARPGEVIVSWTAAEGADHYRIARQSTGTSWVLLDGNVSGLTYTDDTVEAGKRYRYTVCGENEAGKGTGATSIAVEAIPSLTVPGAVESIGAEAQPGMVVVSWTAAEGADHYRLARQSTGTAWVLLDGNVIGLTYTDDTVEAGKRYRYAVCAENAVGKGTAATSAAVTALAPLALPDAVASINAVALPGKVLVTWTAAEGADLYRLARQSTGTGWVLLDGSISGTSYEDTTVEAGKRYRYAVSGENAAGKGASATSAVVTAVSP